MAVGGFGAGGFNQGGVQGFPNAGGTIANRETPQERKDRLEAEDRKQEILNDPYGLRQPAGGPDGAHGPTRLVKKKIRVKRNTGQAEGGNSTNGTGGAEGTGRRAGVGRNGAPGQAGQSLLNRTWNGQSSLVRASVLYQNNQSQNLPQNPSQLGVRHKMLNGLGNYIQNDYNMMKLNPDDKAFTYRTAEARQLNQTIMTMVATSARPSGGKDKTSGTSEGSTTNSRISPEAFGRQKTLLRRLAAMSDPNPRMPDNLPTDYRPFESVA